MYTAISLFSGIGGIDLAFALAGFDITAQVEIDPYCREVLRKHAGQYWPNAAQFIDVRSVGADELGAQADVIFGGFPCFAADTLILTRDGYMPIQDVRVGMFVLSHTGTWRKVTSTMNRHANNTVTINGMGIIETTTTSEHPYFTSLQTPKWDNDRRRYVRSFSQLEWIEAQALTDKHFLTQVLPAETYNDEHTEAFWWIVGRYLADGWRVQRKGRENAGRVVICAAYHESDAIQTAIESAGLRATRVNDRTVVKFHIVRNELYRFLEPFGHGAYGKHLPGWCLELSQAKAAALLDGYMTGDGSRYRNTNGHYAGWKATTVSPALALSMALLAQRARNIVASVHKAEIAEATTIEGRLVRQQTQYQIAIPDRQRSAFIEGKYGYKPVRRTTRTDGTTVYNISVEVDESYIANGAIVHNCQDISIAGKGAGLAGERSGLWYEFRRIIGEVRPRFVFLENVPAITFRGGAEVVGHLAALGYDARWGIVAASDAGAPHRRERWWCVGYRDGLGHDLSTDAGRNGGALRQASTGAHDAAEPERTRPVWQQLGDASGVRYGIPNDAAQDGTNGQQAVSRDIERESQQSRAERTRPIPRPADGSLSQPRMGRDADGLPARLDAHRFPAGPGPQHPWEPPRQIVSRGPHWKHRIKALGNSVVPQCVYPFAVEIMRLLEAD